MRVWIPVKGFSGYEVSNDGLVRNWRTGRILKTNINDKGYLILTLRRDGRQYTEAVHRLVARSFYDGDHDGLDVNHIDGNKLNNHIRNLEYCTRQENIRHAFTTGLKVPSRRMKIRVAETGEIYDSIRDCQRATGFDQSAISKCLSGQQESYRGLYHFEKV